MRNLSFNVLYLRKINCNVMDFFKDKEGIDVPKQPNAGRAIKNLTLLYRILRDFAVGAIFYKQFLG